MEEGYVEVSPNLKLFYRWAGEGPRTVVIPAECIFWPDLEPLAKGRRLLLCDTRHRGRSDQVEDLSLISIDADIADIESITSALDVETFSLIGWSYLGVVASLYAMRHPQQIERLIIGGNLPPRHTPPDKETVAKRTAAAEDRAREFHDEVERLRKEKVDETDPTRFRRAAMMAELANRMGNPSALSQMRATPWELENEWSENANAHLDQIRRSFPKVISEYRALKLETPTLVMFGSEENTPIPAEPDWSGQHADSRLLVLHGAGHLPWLDAPEAFFGAAEEFLSGGWPPESTPIVGQPVSTNV
ncbi:MAG: alpha/beta hydrolase [Actinobacteria bacterium]|nr:alpha/beta hydrolase [Actinomycetota bacterium]